MKSSHPHANERRTPRPLENQTEGLDLFASVPVSEETMRALEDPATRAWFEADVAKRLGQKAAEAISEAEQREIATAAQKSKHPDLIAALRVAAREAYARHQRPISSNDVRHVLDDPKFAGADRRVLAIAFAEKYWTPFGETATTCPGATAQRVGKSRGTIQTYVPTHLLSMWEEKLKADERRTA